MVVYATTQDTATSGAPPVPEPRSEFSETLLSLGLSYPEPGTAVLNVGGEIDLCSSPRLRELMHCRLRSQLRVLVVDLSKVGFLSIDGAQMLVQAASFARRHDTELRIVPGDSRAVRRVFRATGLGNQLPLHPR